MRKGATRSALGLLVVVLWFSVGLSPAATAGPLPKGFGSVTDVARAVDVRAVDLSRDELVLRIDITNKELLVATQELDRLDRTLALATTSAEELRVEADELAEVTLSDAINGFRYSDLPRGLVSAADVNAGLRATGLLGVAVSSDEDSFNAYRDLRKDLEIEEQELEQRRQLVENAQIEVVRLEGQLDDELIRFGELEERRLQDEAAFVSNQAANRAQSQGRKQGFYLDTCPVNGAHSFIDSWGFARSGGRRHEGVDILANIGVELVAPVAGRVEHFSNSVGGRSYRLFDAHGNYFYGTHLSAFGKDGQVNAGEVIGYVGDDGNAAGIPHLHFEIHPGGRSAPAINPYTDVAAVCSGAQ